MYLLKYHTYIQIWGTCAVLECFHLILLYTSTTKENIVLFTTFNWRLETFRRFCIQTIWWSYKIIYIIVSVHAKLFPPWPSTTIKWHLHINVFWSNSKIKDMDTLNCGITTFDQDTSFITDCKQQTMKNRNGKFTQN